MEVAQLQLKKQQKETDAKIEASESRLSMKVMAEVEDVVDDNLEGPLKDLADADAKLDKKIDELESKIREQTVAVVREVATAQKQFDASKVKAVRRRPRARAPHAALRHFLHWGERSGSSEYRRGSVISTGIYHLVKHGRRSAARGGVGHGRSIGGNESGAGCAPRRAEATEHRATAAFTLTTTAVRIRVRLRLREARDGERSAIRSRSDEAEAMALNLSVVDIADDVLSQISFAAQRGERSEAILLRIDRANVAAAEDDKMQRRGDADAEREAIGNELHPPHELAPRGEDDEVALADRADVDFDDALADLGAFSEVIAAAICGGAGDAHGALRGDELHQILRVARGGEAKVDPHPFHHTKLNRALVRLGPRDVALEAV
jgi:hypothetical protein